MNRRASNRVISAMLFVMLGIAFMSPVAQGQATEAPPVHSYQLIYAPLQKIAEMAENELRTMRREQFFSLVERALQTTPPKLSGNAFLQRATYRARLENDQLVDGSAILEVVSPEDHPVRLPIGPINLAIASPRWTRPTEAHAVLGAESDGGIVLLASSSGTLNFDWSRAAETAKSDDLTFHLRLPTCPVNRLELVLPSEYTLHTSHGVPIRTDLDPPDERNGAASGEALWQIELGGNCDLKLRIRPQATDVPGVQLRQANTYAISESGVDLTVDLRLDCGDEVIEQLEIQVDEPLRLARVHSGTKPLSWSVVSSPNGQPTSILIEFDEPLQGNNRAVSLAAIAPVKVNRDHPLPRMRPQSVEWQQEKARILIEPPLAPRELILENARQLPFVEGDDPVPPTPIDIQFLEPEGNIILQIDPLPARYSYSSGVTAVVSEEQAVADIRLHISPESKRLFAIAAELFDDWIVESVESTQDDLIHDWKIESGDGSRRLKVSFRQPLSNSDETILKLRTRRPRTQTEQPIHQSQLRPLRLVGTGVPLREFLVVHPDDEFVVEFQGDRRVTWLTLDDLDATEAQLIDANEIDPIVLLDGNQDDLLIRLSRLPREARPFAASIQITSLITAPYVHEQIRIELDRLPPSPTLGIRLTHPRESRTRWFNADDPQRALPAWRQTMPDNQGEIWYVDTTESPQLPLVITGQRHFSPADQTPLTLAQVEGAVSQEGVILVEASPELDLDLRHSRLLTPTPLDRSGFEQVSRTRKAFRYDASADLLAEASPLVVSILPGSEGVGRTLVWDAKLETHLDQSGIMRCQLSLLVEDHGGGELALGLESDWSVRELTMDHRVAPIRISPDNQLLISLPATHRFSSVQVSFEVTDQPLRVWQQISVPQPRLNVPVLAERRLIWTPPEFTIGRATDGEQSVSRSCFRRLLGPLLRPAHSDPFPLFSREAWSNLAAASAATANWSPATRAWVERLGELSGGTWNSAAAQQDDVLGTTTLWIDVVRLADRGISPGTQLPGSEGRDRKQRGLDRLRKAGLILVETHDSLILTTSEFNTQLRDESPNRSSTVLRQAELSLDDSAAGAGLGLIDAASWSQIPDVWGHPSGDGATYAAVGWRSHQWSGTHPASIVVYRRATFVVAGCVAFLLTLSISWLFRYHNLKLALAGVVLSAAVTLVVPIPFSWIGLGAFWGSLASLILTPFPSPLKTEESRSKVTVLSTASLTGLFLVILLTRPASIFGQDAEPLDSDRHAPPILHRVFIPADEHGEPEGEYVFVPVELQQLLTRHEDRIEGNASDWVFESATYRGTLMRQEGSTSPRVDSILAEYRIHVSSLRRPAQLPIPRESAALLERVARLNGRPIRLAWNANQSALLLPIRDPGDYVLELTYRLRNQGSPNSIDLSIPPVAQSVFLLSSQEKVGPVVVRALGAVRKDETASELRADLGPTDRLRVHWGGPESDDSGLLEQLSWLRIEPDHVFLDVRLIVDPERWQLPSLRIKVDDRLQLDPQSPDRPVNVISSEQAGARILEFDFSPIGDPAVYDLNFNVVGWSGVGRIRLPQFQVLDVDSVGHDLAVSIAPRLEIYPGTLAGADLQPAEQFAEKWGSDESPDYAFELKGRNPRWSCATTLVEAPTQADIQVAYEISREATRVIFLANLTTTGGLYQLKLRVPDNVAVEKIVQIDGSTERELRWSQTGPREVNVFFDPPSANSFQLAILGRQDQLGMGIRRLPSIRLLDCSSNGEQLLVFRKSDVILDGDSVSTHFDAPTQIDPFIANHLGLSRWFATFDLVGEEEAPPLNVTSNDRSMTAHLTNVVTRADGIWQLHVNVEYEVDRGILDAVRFEIPETWMARLPDAMDARVEFGKSPRPGLVRVTIWPKAPLDPSQPMTFAGPIPIKPGEPLQVPNIRLLEDANVDRVLYLPVEVNETPIRWQTQNLELQTFDPTKIAGPTVGTHYACYRIKSDDFQAIRLPMRTSRQQPQILLTDASVVWDTSTSYHGQATYDLVPSGISECRVYFPKGVRPVGIGVENSMVEFQPDESSKGIRVDLESNELPQRIRVLFVAEVISSMPDGMARLQIPRIERLDVDAGESREIGVTRTLWTIHSRRDVSVELRADPESVRSVSDLELTRLESLSTLFDLAAQMTTDFTPSELKRWYFLWGERFRASLRRNTSLAGKSEDQPAQHAISLADLNDHHVEVVEKLMVSDLNQRLQSQHSVDAIDVWREATQVEMNRQFAEFEGAMSFVNAKRRAKTHNWLVLRSVIALLVGLVGLGSIIALSRDQIENVRWMHLFGVLAGLSWWLWLQPSVVGLAIVAMSLLSMVLMRWPAVRV